MAWHYCRTVGNQTYSYYTLNLPRIPTHFILELCTVCSTVHNAHPKRQTSQSPQVYRRLLWWNATPAVIRWHYREDVRQREDWYKDQKSVNSFTPNWANCIRPGLKCYSIQRYYRKLCAPEFLATNQITDDINSKNGRS